jgi:hypothetical protein
MPAMNGTVRKIQIAFKALRQLGWRYTWLYAWYRIQLRSGLLRRRTPLVKDLAADAPGLDLALPVAPLPERAQLEAVLGEARQEVISQADNIVAGKVRLFGKETTALKLIPSGELKHWTHHIDYQHQGVDIKFVWEPGRFGWAIVLARAYLLTNDETYAQAFWNYTAIFLQANPPNCGPHWASAQEVGLRLIALVFAVGVFKDSREMYSERMRMLATAFAAHAERIPPTLGYARAQNNNHLLTEAVALYTAAAALPEHPQAKRWRKRGWRWLHVGLDAQITEDGEYAQHSANYHRLMLQVGLWAKLVADAQGDVFPKASRSKLAAATQWLLGLLDGDSGRLPNLGSNDGAYIFPLTVCAFEDYRPVLQAAGRTFLGKNLLPAGEWDEMCTWLAPELGDLFEANINPPLRLQGEHSWAYLRAAHYPTRPNHADQLHLDLWWRGHNLALDGGTYLYNADPPWRNALDLSSLHNTLTMDEQEQMSKSGQFLWLDWAQAEVVDISLDDSGWLNWAVAQHDGYRKIGVYHRRLVSCEGNIWVVRDQVLPMEESSQPDKLYKARLHWLLPDAKWELHDTTLNLDFGQGEITLKVVGPEAGLTSSLVRAGEVLAGSSPTDPVRGWVSPTYGVKHPALSFAVTTNAELPITLTTTWMLPG